MTSSKLAAASPRMIAVVRLIALLALLISNLVPLAAPASISAADLAGTSRPSAAPAPAATNIAATKTDALLLDNDGDGRADPGDTLRYTVTVSNTGTTDATGLVISDTLDPNTSLVTGSVRVSPLALADSYSALKDTPLTIAAPGLLANDSGTPAPTATPSSKPTIAGGTVTISTNGSFSYTPPSGYTGTDSFTYTATNSAGSDIGAVSITAEGAPIVANTTPANNAIDVPANSNIVITFDEPVNVTASAFALECPNGTPSPFVNTTGTGPATSFTLDPIANLPITTTCTVTVVATEVTDADSLDPPDQMAVNYTFNFITTDAAPEISATTPANGAVNAATNTAISVDFSESVNASASSFDLNCGKGSLTFNVSASPAASFILTPAASLDEGATCTVTVVAAQITDVDAIDPPDTMAANYVFSFSTDAAPTVTITTPANGATDVAANANIVVNFSESVNATASSFTIDCGGAQTFTLSAAPAGSFTLDPTADLPTNVTCTVTVVAANVTDADTNDPPDTMVADYTFSFGTDAAPTVTSTAPANGATDVATNANIVVNFSESVNATTSSFTVDCGGAQAYALSATPAASFTLDPTADLPTGVSCTVMVVAAQVTDADANDPPDTMVANYVFSFTTDAAPSVTGTTPTNGATDVATNANIVVNFSESVNATASSFTIDCGGAQTFTLSAAPAGNFTLDPTADLPDGVTCTVTVVAAQVTDADANDPPDTMVANYVFSFTTDAAPTVTSTSPTNGATNVAASANIVVNFSESVNATTSSFTVICEGSGQPYALSASPAGSFTLNPTGNLPEGGSCTVTVVAAQVTDADANDPPDTMVANYVFSFIVAPDAVDDAYTGVGNTLMEVSVTASGTPSVKLTGTLLDNDISVTPITASVGSPTTANGGTVTVNPNGSFSYTPPLGFTGVDSFTYTITAANGGTDSATVQITLAERVWYVRNNAAAGDGRSNSPFNTLAAAQTASAVNDHIFVHRGDGTTTNMNAGITLKNGQRLIGEDIELIVGGFSLHPDGAAPLIGNSAGSGITLASNNTARGLTVGNTTAAGITGTNFGTLTLDTVTVNTGNGALSLTTGTANATFISVTSTGGANNINLDGVAGTVTLGSGALSGATSHAFNVNAGTATISYAGTIGNTTARSVSITNKTAGTVTLSGAVSGTGSGVFLNTNTGATINFSGGLTLSTGANAAFTATGGGTVSVTGATNTIATTTGTALNVANTTIGASGLTFKSISANGAPNGIALNNTGSSGSLLVTGDGNTATGGNDSGGTIQFTTGAGISLASTFSPSFTNMNIHDIARNGIDGTGVTNFTFVNGKIVNTGTAAAGQYEENLIGFDDGGTFTTTTVSGVVTITGNIFTQPHRNGIDLETGGGTISNLTISNNNFSGGTTTGSILHGILVLAQGSASTTAHITTGKIQNNTISGFEFFSGGIFTGGSGIFVAGGSGNASNATVTTLGTAVNPIEISGNDVDNVGSNGIAVSFNGQQGISNFNIHDNGTAADPMSNMEGLGISVFFGGSGTFSALVNNNAIDNNGPTVNAGSSGIAVQLDDGPAALGNATGVANITVNNNVVSNPDGFGIRGIVRASNGTLNLKIQNNDVGTPSAANRNAIRADSGSAAGNTTLCLNMTGNTGIGGGNLVGSGVNAGIGVRKQGTVTNVNFFGINGIAANPTTAQVQSYLAGLNPTTGVDIVSGSGYMTCSLPLLSAGGEGAGAASITQSELSSVTAEANARWGATGISASERAKLAAVSFSLADLEPGHLGGASAASVLIDRDAAGWGWFVDATPSDDAEFTAGEIGAERQAGAGSPAYKQMDLLTVVMHELGHVLGRDDIPSAEQPHMLMAEELPTGARRVPTAAAVARSTQALAPATVTTTPSSVQADIGTLPAGKHVVMYFDVLIAAPIPQGVGSVSNQASISGSNFATLPTDDPATSAAADPTVTALDVVKKVFLPLIFQSVAQAPDLVVTSVTLSPNKTSFTTSEPVQISVVIKNQGNAPTTPFWVDLYLNPSHTPTLNLIWSQVCSLSPCYGIAWQVTQPLAPGAELTLTSTVGSFAQGYSNWRERLAAGTTDLYVQADSWNPGKSIGASGDTNLANNLFHMSGLHVTGQNVAAAEADVAIPARPAAGQR